MKKILITVISILVLSLGYWLISPFFIDVRVDETLPTEFLNQVEGQIVQNPAEMIVMTGNFVGFDRIHTGTGTVSVYTSNTQSQKTILRFEEGFRVNNGPDLYVGFGRNGEYVKGSEIAKLKGNVGAQNYEIDGVDLNQYDSVWVWCKAFSTPFVKAELRPVDADSSVTSISPSGETVSISNPKIIYKNSSREMVQVELPYPGAVTGKSFSVIGKAVGYWFFEGSFPIKVYDTKGKEIARSVALVQNGEEWMTTNLVSFKADIVVPESYIGPAVLTLQKDNPSGLQEHDASVSFPFVIEY